MPRVSPVIPHFLRDLGLPHLGAVDSYSLLKTVNIIIHNGAIVNSLLPYKSLYDANVIGKTFNHSIPNS